MQLQQQAKGQRLEKAMANGDKGKGKSKETGEELTGDDL